MMTLSFVIPVYNCKEYLEQCVDSLLRVKGCKYEILLIDDGSADGSSVLCDRLSVQHKCVRCVHQENRGVSAARNRGLDEAEGEWIMFADADDTVDTIALNGLIEETERDHELDAVLFGMSFDYYFHGKNYRSDQMSVSSVLSIDKEQLAEKMRELYEANYFAPVWNKLFKKSILLNNGIRFDTELFLLEDLDFSLRYLAFCEKALCSDRIVYHYRQAEDEGNAGRRLKRIPKISSLADRLYAAFSELASGAQRDPAEMLPTVTGIFLMLARQKAAVSDQKTILSICDDFREWTIIKGIPQEELDSEYARMLLDCKADKLIAKRNYTKLRHWLANRAKYLRFLVRGGK